MTLSQPSRRRVATVGAAYTANKGAGSMLQAIVDGLPDIDIDVHSTYPKADAAALRSRPNATVIAAPPRSHALADFPLALVAGACRRVGLPWRWACRTPSLRSLSQADAVADVTGISFSSARPAVFAPYHLLLVAVPMLLGVPTVKCAQAMGPFDKWWLKVWSPWLLRRLHTVVARGPGTADYLKAADVDHIEAHDLAFVMDVSAAERAVAVEQLKAAGINPEAEFVTVAPSSLVMGKSEAEGIDYVAEMAELIVAVRAKTGLPVALIAHSSQPSEPADAESIPERLNDLVVARRVAQRLRDDEGVALIDYPLLPSELRAVIDASTLLITSRFHAMVSALAVGTPPLVVGWSHKYLEVLDAFGLDDLVIDYRAAAQGAVVDAAVATLDRQDEIRARINEALPRVKASAQQNLLAIQTAAEGS